MALSDRPSAAVLAGVARRLLMRNKAACEKSLAAFIRCAWHVPEPSVDYLHNWHIDAISEYLTAVTRGQIKRLVINIPPRMAKTLTSTVMWPVWEWTANPAERYIFNSYSAGLAHAHSIIRRNIIQSTWYQERWGWELDEETGLPKLDRDDARIPWVQIADDQNRIAVFQNTRSGRMQTTSTGGTVTGFGGNKIIIDDPHNVEQGESDTERDSSVRFCDRTLFTRLDDKKKGAIVVIMQRLHEKDYSGTVLRRGGWEHLCIPNPNDTRRTYILPISKKKITREVNQLMWPEREGEPEIAEARRALGEYGFAGQYGQAPAPAEGVILKRKFWKYYKELPTLEAKVQSWDCAFKDKADSDFVAGLVGGKKGADIFIMDYVMDKMGYAATKKAMELWSAGKHMDYTALLIEDKANGTAIIEELQSSLHNVIAIEPKGGKIARASACAPTLEAGNIWLPDPAIFPEHALWVGALIENCTKFPRGANDDDVDALTQLVSYLKQYGGGFAGYVLAQAEKIKAEREAQRKKDEEERERVRTLTHI
jgi:predicted phage terminase large subunit-like protein